MSPNDILAQMIADFKAKLVDGDHLSADIRAQHLEVDHSKKHVELAAELPPPPPPPLPFRESAECNQPPQAHSEAAASRLESMLQAMRADPIFRMHQARKIAQTAAAPPSYLSLGQTLRGSAPEPSQRGFF